MILWDDIKDKLDKRHQSSLYKLFETCAAEAQLFAACAIGDAVTAAQLLSQDPSLARATAEKQTPIHLACYYGHHAIVEMLFNAGVDANTRLDSHQDTPLHIAAKEGRQDVTALILERGADVNIRNASGNTPVQTAAAKNHPEIIRILARASANLENRDNLDCNPLQQALYAGHVEAALELLECGADANADTSKQPLLWFRLKSADEWPPLAECEGTRPLYIAACCCPPLVEPLLDAGAQMNALSFGWSALHAAAAKPDKVMVELLLRRGADPHIKSAVKSPLGAEYNHRTPLEWLAGFRRCADLLRSALL